MAAIGYAYGKQVYCFPWFSRKLFELLPWQSYFLLDMLEELGVIAIVPLENSDLVLIRSFNISTEER